MQNRMIRSLTVVALLVMATAPAIAQEKVQLATPVQAPAITEYAITYFGIDVENQRLRIELKANTGAMKSIIYRNSEPVSNADGTVTPSDNKATNLIRALNRADLSVKSLERRIFEQLVADGHLAGSVVGTPRLPEQALRLSIGDVPDNQGEIRFYAPTSTLVWTRNWAGVISWRDPDDARRIGQSLLRGGTH